MACELATSIRESTAAERAATRWQGLPMAGARSHDPYSSLPCRAGALVAVLAREGIALTPSASHEHRRSSRQHERPVSRVCESTAAERATTLWQGLSMAGACSHGPGLGMAQRGHCVGMLLEILVINLGKYCLFFTA